MELLVEKSSQCKSFVKLTSPWRSQASLDEIHFPSTTVFSCLSSALGIHQIRTKAEWAFAFENPLAFYFLPALSQHLLEKKCLWLKVLLFVKQCGPHCMAQPLGCSPPRLCWGRTDPA